MSRPGALLLTSLTLCVAASSTRAAAQGANPPPPPVKEQIEVVATRLPETPHEVPASIEVIDGDTLRAMGATTLQDALSLAAGVVVAPGGDAGPAGAVPEFWGLREFDAFLLVVDDIPWGGAFNPALTTRGVTFQYTTPLDGSIAPAVAEPSTLDLDSESRREFFGGYASAEWTPMGRLHVSTGLRLNATVERRGEGASTTHVRPAGSLGAVVGIWERGADHFRVFANYRDTFKPAAFDFSLAENEGVLEPETARSYEGGVKARAARGRLDLEASLFRMNFRNLVTSTVVGGLPALQNSGTSRFQGFEAAADARGPHRTSARFTYSLHDGTFLDFVQALDGVNTQLAGMRVEMSARHLLSAGLIVAPAHGFVGHLITNYTGDRYLDKRNGALAPGFTTLDAGAGYRLDRWELRVEGRNLGNGRDAVSESELGDAQCYLLPARRIDATIAVSF